MKAYTRLQTRLMLRLPTFRRASLALLLVMTVVSCSMAGLAYELAPGMAVRYADDYLELSRRQEVHAKRLFLDRKQLHERDELPRYHALLAKTDAAIRDGIEHDDIDELFGDVRELYRLGVSRTIPQVAEILADVDEKQIDILERRLERDAEEDREEIDEAEEEHDRELADTFEDIEEWIGPLSDSQRKLIRKKLREREPTRPFWVEWRVARNQALVALLRTQPSRSEIEAFLVNYWVERADMPRYLEEALERNGELYRDMIVALDRSLSVEQRARARERVAEYREMVLDMMPEKVRLAVLEERGSSTRGLAGQ